LVLADSRVYYRAIYQISSAAHGNLKFRLQFFLYFYLPRHPGVTKVLWCCVQGPFRPG